MMMVMTNYRSIRDFLTALLTGCGFARKGSVFQRQFGEVVHIIELQKYSFKVNGHDCFTLRIGVVIPKLFQKAFKKDVTPEACEGIINFYVDELMGNFDKKKMVKKDWTLDEQFDLSELKGCIQDHVIPFFRSVYDLESVLHFIQSTNFFTKNFPATTMQLEELKKEIN